MLKIPQVGASAPRTAVAPPFGLSIRLLVLTLLFVLVAEALIYVPSLANYRKQWLKGRVESAEIAILAMSAASGELEAELEATLVEGAGVLGATIEGGPHPIAIGSSPPADLVVDLRRNDFLTDVREAWRALSGDRNRILAVLDAPARTMGDILRVEVEERSLRMALMDYSHNILWLSALISMVTALMVFVACRFLFVKPVIAFAERISAIRDDPEAAPLSPSRRARDEIGIADEALRDMHQEVRRALAQRARLARLGEAVAKINHDLRNILASAQLAADSLKRSDDPRVAQLAPRLINAVDRAIQLCTKTLNYSGSDEPEPQREAMALRPVLEEALEAAGFSLDGPFVMRFGEGAERVVQADAHHVYRITLNLARNALQAMERAGRNRGMIEITVEDAEDGLLRLVLRDDGPGVPEKAAVNMFKPFAKGASGSGLGLSIARQLARNHGGDVRLIERGAPGAAFEVTLAVAA